jgi:hypothetical protein
MKAEKKPRKKYERGLTKKVLAEIKNLSPHFTPHQLAARTSMSVEQAQKICGYLKNKGYVKVIGHARLSGVQGGKSESLYEPTEAYEKMRKEQPSLFTGLGVVPTPIEKAREAKEGVTEDAKQIKLLQKKVDGLFDLLERSVLKFTGLYSLGSLEIFVEDLKKLKDLKPGA